MDYQQEFGYDEFIFQINGEIFERFHGAPHPAINDYGEWISLYFHREFMMQHDEN